MPLPRMRNNRRPAGWDSYLIYWGCPTVGVPGVTVGAVVPVACVTVFVVFLLQDVRSPMVATLKHIHANVKTFIRNRRLDCIESPLQL